MEKYCNSCEKRGFSNYLFNIALISPETENYFKNIRLDIIEYCIACWDDSELNITELDTIFVQSIKEIKD